MYLNQANHILGLYHASTGGITGTIADIRIILSVALKILATSFVVAHNHPSGSLTPSRVDEELTKKLKESAKTMDIKLLDHLIISPQGTYYSFGDNSLL
jgi:DNA repair protein RadC